MRVEGTELLKDLFTGKLVHEPDVADGSDLVVAYGLGVGVQWGTDNNFGLPVLVVVA